MESMLLAYGIIAGVLVAYIASIVMRTRKINRSLEQEK